MAGRRVDIVGKGIGWEDAPEGNIWGITQLILRRPVNLVIDMNDYSLWGEQEKLDADKAMAIACQSGVPYIDLETYPLADIIGHFGTDYFTSTVDYAIALAIYGAYDEIHLWGVNMELGGEYYYQKPGVDFWCGVAIGKGIKIVAYGERTTIMKSCDRMLYGYGTPQLR
jgi:hypothetical protein